MLMPPAHDKRQIDFVGEKLRETVREKAAREEQLDAWVPSSKAIDSARKNFWRQSRRNRDAQQFKLARSCRSDGGSGMVCVGGNRFCVWQQASPRSVEPQPERRAIEKRTAELLLEPAHGLRDRRLRQAEFVGGAPHASCSHDCKKGFDLSNFHDEAFGIRRKGAARQLSAPEGAVRSCAFWPETLSEARCRIELPHHFVNACRFIRFKPLHAPKAPPFQTPSTGLAPFANAAKPAHSIKPSFLRARARQSSPRWPHGLRTSPKSGSDTYWRSSRRCPGR